MDQTTTLQELALKLAAITDILEQRVQQTAQQSAEGAQQLNYGAQQINYAAQSMQAHVQQIGNQVIGAITSQAQQSVEQAIAQTTAAQLQQLRDQLKQVGESATESAKLIGDQAKALGKSQKTLVTRGGIALLVGAVLAAGGSALYVWRMEKRLERVEFADNVLAATRSGAITPCGESLCARIGAQPVMVGGEYATIQMNNASGAAPAAEGKPAGKK